MATKVYGIFGRTSVEIVLPVGKARLPLSFERGSLDKKYFRPATFMTSKKYIQDMIENSELFGSTIKLIKVINTAEKSATVESIPEKKQGSRRQKPSTETDSREGGDGDATDFPEIDSREGAIEILKQNGAKATDLVSDDKIHAFMAKMKITFSNFSF